MSPTKWGIISAGVISYDFANSLTTLDPSEHVAAAIAARSLDKAGEFAKLFNIGKTYGNYKDLMNDPDIDIVYVGAIHPVHLEICKMALEAGKPVLCEKPLAMNLRESKEIINLAKEKNVFLMEALWSRMHPTQLKLKEILDQGEIGEVMHCHSVFGMDSKLPRLHEKKLGGGALMDVGIYTIYFSQLAFNGERPQKIQASGHLNEDGVDANVSVIMTYSGGKTATFTINCKVAMDCQALVYGTKGSATLAHPFWCGEKLTTSKDGEMVFPLKAAKLPNKCTNATGLRYEAQHVRDCLLQGLKESPLVTHAESLLVMEIMDDIRKQIGVVYEQD